MIKYFIIFIAIYTTLVSFCHANEDSYEENIITFNINDEQWDNLYYVMRNKTGNFLILYDDIKSADLNEDYLQSTLIKLHDKEYIDISKLDRTQLEFDDASLNLKINFPADKFNKQLFDFKPNIIRDKDILGRETQGAFLNYDLTLSNVAQMKYVTSIQDFNYFTPSGIFNTSFFARSEIPKKGSIETNNKKKVQNKLVRLDSNWTFDNVDDMARWRIGDSITRPADWSGSSRLFGIQYSTNFSVRPDLITHPLLNFTNRAELPSTLDIYANSVSMFSSQSRTGDYELANLPVPVGRGELMIKAQDIAGKTQTFILPYYIPPNLLAKDLGDFSYEIGLQRHHFGNEESSYKNLIINTDYNKGINDEWTSGIHLESLKDQFSIGTTNHIKLSEYGVASASIATNLNALSRTQKLVLGYSYQGKKFNYHSSIGLSGKKYQDIYIYPIRNSTSPTFNSTISYSSKKLGDFLLNFMFSYVQDSYHKQDKLHIISGTYTKAITASTIFRFTIGSNLKRKERTDFGYISFSKNFGSKNLDINNSYHKKDSVKRLDYSDPVNKPLGWGHRVSIMSGKTNDYDLQLDNRSQKLETSLYLYSYGGEHAQQIGFTGAIVEMDRDFYLTKPIYSSLALVKVGNFKNIPVYHNNQKVGYTDNKGKILIPNIISYIPSEIRLDPKKLPLDTNLASTVIRTAPDYKSGVLLNFEVTKIRSVVMTLTDVTKKYMPFDQEVTVEGITEELFLGYNGKLYINDIGNLPNINGKTCSNEINCCHFNMEIDKNDTDPIIDLGEVICH